MSLKAEVMSVCQQLFPLVSLCRVSLGGVEKRILPRILILQRKEPNLYMRAIVVCVADVALNSYIVPLCLTSGVIKF